MRHEGAEALARELLRRAADAEEPAPLVEAARVLLAEAAREATAIDIREARRA